MLAPNVCSLSGNYYGTPKPSGNSILKPSDTRRVAEFAEVGQQESVWLPQPSGMSPLLPVATTASPGYGAPDQNRSGQNGHQQNWRLRQSPSYSLGGHLHHSNIGTVPSSSNGGGQTMVNEDELGPLPTNWEIGFTGQSLLASNFPKCYFYLISRFR